MLLARRELVEAAAEQLRAELLAGRDPAVAEALAVVRRVPLVLREEVEDVHRRILGVHSAAEMEEDRRPQGGFKGGIEMAVLMTLEVPGGTTAKYDRANEILGIAGEHDAPPGLVTHVCGVTDDGILVVDVWESIAALDDFARNRLGAALAQAEMPEAVPHTSPVHNLLFGAGKESNVLVLIDMAGLHGRGLRRDHRGDARAHRQRRAAPGRDARRSARAGRQHPRRRPLGLRGGVRRVRARRRSARPPAARCRRSRRASCRSTTASTPAVRTDESELATDAGGAGGEARERPRHVRRARDRRVERVGEPRRGRRRRPSAAAGP